jgi:hypothetical protein
MPSQIRGSYLNISETLLLLSCAADEAALRFPQGDGKIWTKDVDARRIYIDLLHGAEKFYDLHSFCEDCIEDGADDWKIVKGWGFVGSLLIYRPRMMILL